MKRYNLNISFVRAVLCIAVLLYHLNILKGGYLAVCSFFVISGYYSYISLSKEKSLLKYYIKRLKKIYLPLIVTVFSTISIIYILKITIFNMKSEITSILFGYNNYWQLGANVDYFAKHVNSPFTHMWYISVLIQIEIIFPIVFNFIRKHKKPGKTFFLILLLTTSSIIIFYYNILRENVMWAYYDTISRLFSFTFGTLLGFFHLNLHKIIVPKINSKLLFTIYMILLIALFILIPSTSKNFGIIMIITSLITMRIIDYSIILFKKGICINSKIMNLLSEISYEIYLVQFPVIYLFSFLKLPWIIEIGGIVLITIIISWLIHLPFKKNTLIFFKTIIILSLLVPTGFGLFKYINMKDNTKEINHLKQELSENEKLMQEKQKQYQENQMEEIKKRDDYLKQLEDNSKNVEAYVTNLKLVGVGDSVMLDAIPNLYEKFPNGYFDAKISRNTCASYDVLNSIKSNGINFDTLIFNLGTNGVPTRKCKDNLMSLAENKDVFWLTATHADYDNNNDELIKYANEFENIHVLYWDNYVKDHQDYLYSDQTHLKPSGNKAYAEYIKTELIKYYQEKIEKDKENAVNEYKNEQKQYITFYGDELLISLYEKLQKEFENAIFNGKENLKPSDLIKMLKNQKVNDELSNKMVFIFSPKNSISKNEYQKIIDLEIKSEIYIVTTSNLKSKENIKIIKISKKGYFKDDGIRLTNAGSKTIMKKLTTLKSQ